MKKRLKPEEIVDFNIDYYEILGIKPEDLPKGGTRADRQEITAVLKKAYRQKARIAHPDFGGTEDDFKMLVRAEFILEDPILRRYYDSKGEWRPSLSGEGTDFEINWDNLGTYRQGTEADTVGYGLFLDICQNKEKFNLVPAFRPSDETHNYEWDWVIPDKITHDALGNQNPPPKIALSIVYDEEDVLRLTSGEDAITDSLPFKIYICIPRSVVQYLRGEKEVITLPNGSKDVFRGRLLGVAYSDLEFLETTKLQEAQSYVADRFGLDLASFRDGTMEARQKELDRTARRTMSVNSQVMQDADREMLKAIMRGKMRKVEYDPTAADFLKDLPQD